MKNKMKLFTNTRTFIGQNGKTYKQYVVNLIHPKGDMLYGYILAFDLNICWKPIIRTFHASWGLFHERTFLFVQHLKLEIHDRKGFQEADLTEYNSKP